MALRMLQETQSSQKILLVSIREHLAQWGTHKLYKDDKQNQKNLGATDL